MKYYIVIIIAAFFLPACKKDIQHKQTVKFSFEGVKQDGVYWATKITADDMLTSNAYLKVRWSIYEMKVMQIFNETPTPNISFIYKFVRYEYADVTYDKYFNGLQTKRTTVFYPKDILYVIAKSPVILEIKSDDTSIQPVW